MNIAEAKRIPLPELLASLGFTPAKQAANGDLWYLSPFREETAPSFKVEPRRNIWYDHGAGQGGTVIDFLMQHLDLSSPGQVLGYLSRPPSARHAEPPPAAPLPLFPDAPEQAAPQSALTDAVVKPLASAALAQYLASRGISVETARRYDVQELHYYTRGGKPYFALAFANQSGGYELRNPYFKGCHGAKDISVVVPASGPLAPTVAVFEGFLDFLSAVELKLLQPGELALVLNSVALREKAVAWIREHRRVGGVRIYADNDHAGRSLAALLREELHNSVTVSDESAAYAPCKDLNDHLVAAVTERRK